MSKPVAGAAIAVFCALVIRGMSIPFEVLVTSSIELALATAPVVLTLKDWEEDEKCKVIATVSTITMRKSLAMVKTVYESLNK